MLFAYAAHRVDPSAAGEGTMPALYLHGTHVQGEMQSPSLDYALPTVVPSGTRSGYLMVELLTQHAAKQCPLVRPLRHDALTPFAAEGIRSTFIPPPESRHRRGILSVYVL